MSLGTFEKNQVVEGENRAYLPQVGQKMVRGMENIGIV
jgi:hypothetical protein